MTKKQIKNIAVSVRQKLLNLSREKKEDFNFILQRYAFERFLYRLGISPYREQFLLKGGMLLILWTGASHRATRDIDLLGFGNADIVHLENVFKEICDQAVNDDGIVFLSDMIKGEAIRAEKAYTGVRITFQARIEQAKCSLQIDIGFGDIVTPKAEEVEYPCLLHFPAPKLKAYPIYSVIAEKFEAIIKLDFSNSRMKDFYDIWFLLKHNALDKTVLWQAIKATFQQRGTKFPKSEIAIFTPAFIHQKEEDWAAFLKRINADYVEFEQVIFDLKDFFEQVLILDDSCLK
ncbi:nucleotidyl transferase AbiEii/AbiGii toxin family protein [Thioflexithrix psekupsensis]|uniref:Nucleotidyltransferase n=1 Tax=Thioflexithrix psekupsensis TaxID=1570016 RepID=A0A251X8M7_9GAMM|nr:nucleotidyl transferase AbiEii/AbiGii toxin family protein [Thioflexithrix psekupsensis]OUD14428.1 hypothetical protein TPSD3_08960 [Thioflexithrix psekupsensis]